MALRLLTITVSPLLLLEANMGWCWGYQRMKGPCKFDGTAAAMLIIPHNPPPPK